MFNRFHQELAKPVNNNNIGKWQGQFNKKELLYMDFLLGDYGLKYLYPKTYPEINKYPKIFYLKKISAEIIHYLDKRIIRIYYLYLPFGIRNLLRFLSNKLYGWFGYKNYYNVENFQIDEKTIS